MQNVGVLDSTVRIGLGFALLLVGFLLPEPAGWAAYVGFVTLVISGFAGKCPLYSALGISTCERERPCASPEGRVIAAGQTKRPLSI